MRAFRKNKKQIQEEKARVIANIVKESFEKLRTEEGKWQEQHATQYLSTDLTNILGEKLANIEDKIENGTLIEMPRIVRRVDMSCGYEDYLVQWEKDDGKIKSRTYSNEKRAKAKLRELKEK